MGATHDGKSYFEISMNILRAREWGKRVIEAGAFAFVPHLNSEHYELDVDKSADWWREADLAILKRCDAIFMMPGWEKSKGAVKEKEFAEREKIPVFYGIDTLRAWIRRVEGEAAPHVTTTGAPVFGPSLNLNLTIPNVDQKSAREFLENAAPTIRKAIADNLPPEEKPHASKERKNIVWDDGMFGPHHGYMARGEAKPPTRTPDVGTTAVIPEQTKPHVALRANSLSKEANAILQELLPCIKRIVAEAIAELRRTYGPVA